MLALAMCLGLTACGGDNGGDSNDNNDSIQTPPPVIEGAAYDSAADASAYGEYYGLWEGSSGAKCDTLAVSATDGGMYFTFYKDGEIMASGCAQVMEEYDQLLGTDELDPDAAYPTVDENSITFSTTPDGQVIGKEDHIVNILLIGQDRREGEGRSRSDSMILVSFNKKTNKITMASFLRDNYVQLPDDYLPNRLNAAYAIGGMEMLDETLEINFGVSVDANLEVDFSSFSSIIDILGGVDIELTEAEASHMNGENGWGLTGGMNHLDGEQALTYSRIRKLDSDFGRTNRQRNVLTSLFQAFKNIDLTQALGLINEIFPLLTTDMSNAEMIGYVTDLLPMLAKAELTSVHIPGDEDYYNATIRGMMVLVPDLDACREVLAEALQ